MARVIQLRGTNGTGKTTAVRRFLSNGNFAVRQIDVSGRQVEFHYDEERGIILLGRYDQSVSGGVDGRITSKYLLADAILKALREVRPRALIFEGIVYGVTFKFAYDLFRMLKRDGHEYIGICLIPPLDVAIDRVQGRNGGKPIDFMSVQGKWFTAQRAYTMLKEAGVPVVQIDTSKVEKDNMHRIIEEWL